MATSGYFFMATDTIENHFGVEPTVQIGYSIETFAWDDEGNLLVKTYYAMPEEVGPDDDPYAHLLRDHD